MLDRVRIVLSHTSHPGNIGAAARAMKVMGLSELVLVNPRDFRDADGNLHPEAQAMAAGALDLLQRARIVSSLEQAIGDCHFVCGTSARTRFLSLPLLAPRAMVVQARTELARGPLALLFGTERTGLSNDELQRCHAQVYIPSNPEYSSLNLAQAVQILSYELRAGLLDERVPVRELDAPVGNAELERFYTHLEQMMAAVDFLKADNPKPLMAKLRRLYNRAQPTQDEMNILRGTLKAILNQTASKSS